MGFQHGARITRRTPQVVPVIHLTQWIQHHVAERRLPVTSCGTYSQSTRERDKVVMKLDIEGNDITSGGLPSVARILDTTQVQKLEVGRGDNNIFSDDADFDWDDDDGFEDRIFGDEVFGAPLD